MKRKLCHCHSEQAFYYDFGIYRCQYCDGILPDLERVRSIIDYNTPVNEKDRKKTIEQQLDKQRKIIENLASQKLDFTT